MRIRKFMLAVSLLCCLSLVFSFTVSADSEDQSTSNDLYNGLPVVNTTDDTVTKEDGTIVHTSRVEVKGTQKDLDRIVQAQNAAGSLHLRSIGY